MALPSTTYRFNRLSDRHRQMITLLAGSLVSQLGQSDNRETIRRRLRLRQRWPKEPMAMRRVPVPLPMSEQVPLPP
ncbi:unnamed protein product [Soboliphyme baturini]|uniref:Transposase n=1 Tax=Soboliphyme baturini TaxID=241478 RepID=A0A183IEU9_9BILA|nr:unnamed protein product [Soboliphyme baturini]